MSNNDDIKTRLENLKGYMYDEIQQSFKDNQGPESSLHRFRPSKHKKAYRVENNLKKRCYAR